MSYIKDNNIAVTSKVLFFTGKRSIVLELLIRLDKWIELLDQGGVVDPICSDFMKAFENLPHKCLLG